MGELFGPKEKSRFRFFEGPAGGVLNKRTAKYKTASIRK